MIDVCIYVYIYVLCVLLIIHLSLRTVLGQDALIFNVDLEEDRRRFGYRAGRTKLNAYVDTMRARYGWGGERRSAYRDLRVVTGISVF